MYKSLFELATVEYGRSPNAVRNTDGPYPIYGTGGMVGFSKSFLFDRNGVVVARKGTLDRPSYVEGNYWVIDTAYATFPKESVDAKWLYYCLNNYNLKN